MYFSNKFLLTGASVLGLMAGSASADQVFQDDVIVVGSLCAGQDCANGESFGFDTIRMKENNLRITAQDTSSASSFPSTDWRFVFNESTNGGANKFAVQNVTANKVPFQIFGDAPDNSLVVNSAGRVGFGVVNPIVNLHVAGGNTATLRLEQNGSAGFTPQTWDIAGNEANFFVRDVTNGSALPFRIEPGTASDTLYLAKEEQVGINTKSPGATLHVKESTGAFATVLLLENNGPMAMIMDNTGADAVEWRIGQVPGATDIVIVTPDVAGNALTLSTDGNLTVSGNYFTAAGQLNVPDYVFADDYELMSLNQVRAFIEENNHLPRIPSAADINKSGLDMTQMQMALLEKVEELTLYTLAQQDTISGLQSRLDVLEN
jgi:hypothetical protein